MILRSALGFLALAGSASAEPWTFGDPIEVAPEQGAGVFHHLESAGGKSLAVGSTHIAVVWEDNRTGAPRTYVALKERAAAAFQPARLLSTGGKAFEPAVVALSDGRFASAWEQDGAVWARVLDSTRLGPARRVAAHGQQVTLALLGRDRLVGVWSERRGRHARVRRAELRVAGMDFAVGAARTVDPEPPGADQLYPAVAVTSRGIVIGWEDRRYGHTLLLYTHASGIETRFSTPRVLNEQPARRSAIYGKGPGAARPVFTPLGTGRVAAAWLDKRDFTSGYDVYAAFSDEGGRRFGANEKVQDEFGNTISQWHATIAANAAGRVAVVWSDDRDDSLDLWLSWPEAGGWSADSAIPGASGPGVQSHPALALDEDGNLHVAWIEQAEVGSPTRVRYAMGQLTNRGP